MVDPQSRLRSGSTSSNGPFPYLARDSQPYWYWPKYAQRQGLAPIPCRLIRVPAKGKGKGDVWLLSDVLDSARLSAATAAQFSRGR